MNGIYAVMVVTGNFVAPIAAGFIVGSQGWRWVCWYNATFMGIAALLFIFVYEDTKYISTPQGVIGRSVTQTSHQQEEPRLNEKEINNTASATVHGMEPAASNTPHTDSPQIPRHGYFRRMRLYTISPGTSLSMYTKHMTRPFILMVRIPALAFVAFQYGILLCWIAILATTQATLFLYPPYNFTSQGIGLLSLAPFLGTTLGSIWGGPLNDRYVLWVAKRRNGLHEPETRLHGLILPLISTPAGLLIYGISLAHGTHWIVPCIGSFCVGVGINSSAVILVTYYSDAYREVSRLIFQSPKIWQSPDNFCCTDPRRLSNRCGICTQCSINSDHVCNLSMGSWNGYPKYVYFDGMPLLCDCLGFCSNELVRKESKATDCELLPGADGGAIILVGWAWKSGA